MDPGLTLNFVPLLYPILHPTTNSSFLTLIPKESNPLPFSRFQPTSLSNVSYKILVKIITNKIKKESRKNDLQELGVLYPKKTNSSQHHHGSRGDRFQ